MPKNLKTATLFNNRLATSLFLCYNTHMNQQAKYPIILVPGLFLKETKLFKAFGKLEKYLKNNSQIVFTAPVDAFGAVETNAEQLKNFVEKILIDTNSKKVNLIAYSKGGLDCIYMIEEFAMKDKIASLTTLSTPHKGTPLASYILSYPNWLVKSAAFCVNLWYKIIGDKKPNFIKICRQMQPLQERKAISFSKTVYCQSYSSIMTKRRDHFIMALPFRIFKRLEKTDTDGAVSVESAKFENYKGNCLNETLSHSELACFMVKRKKKKKIFDFYLKLTNELAEMGF